MSIPHRFYRIARYKLNELKERFDRLDEEAQVDWETDQKRRQTQSRSEARRELDDAMVNPPNTTGRTAPAERPPATTGSAPLPRRTPEEIARGQRDPGFTTAPPPSSAEQFAALDPLLIHYQRLGLEAGSDFAAVQSKYNQLAARADPIRFPAGSSEEKMAQDIRAKLDASFKVLRDALDPTARRFELLEFDDDAK